MKNFAHYIKDGAVNLKLFSKKSGISETRLKTIRDEQALPSYSELSIISEILHLPISFLLGEKQRVEKYNVLFRKQYGSPTDDIVINNFNFYVENILELPAGYFKSRKYPK